MAAQMSTNKLTLSLLRQSERKQLKLDEEVSNFLLPAPLRVEPASQSHTKTSQLLS